MISAIAGEDGSRLRSGIWTRRVAWTSGVWLALVLVFGVAQWADAVRWGTQPAPLTAYLVMWARGTVPWLILFPVVFGLARALPRRQPRAVLVRAALMAVASTGLAMTYVVLLSAALSGRSVVDILSGLLLMEWMWDLTFFCGIFVAGLAARPNQASSPTAGVRDLVVRSADRTEYIPVADILGVSAQGNYAALHLASRDVLHRATLGGLADQLASAGFLRTHRSHLVRPERVRRTRERGGGVFELQLENGVCLPVSRRYSRAVKARLAARVQP